MILEVFYECNSITESLPKDKYPDLSSWSVSNFTELQLILKL
jgi:hypothetical protein